jgi:predicted membrane chloride channel (bestrophin family)
VDAPTLSMYIFADMISTNNDSVALLYTTLNQLVDALTGLERILTTPIPVSCVIGMRECFARLLLTDIPAVGNSPSSCGPHLNG